MSIREPLQNLPACEETNWNHSGKKPHTGLFPCQESQLPIQLSSLRVYCLLSLHSWTPTSASSLPGDTQSLPKAYRGHSSKAIAMTFTHPSFDTDNYHMCPKSTPRLHIYSAQSSFCEYQIVCKSTMAEQEN